MWLKNKIAEAAKTEKNEKHVIADLIKQGDTVGRISYSLNGKTIGETQIKAAESVGKIGFFDVLGRVFGVLFMR